MKGPLVVMLVGALAGLASASLPMHSQAQDARGQSPELLSAFFGLDNGLGFRINLICPGGSGEDGMPVIFSHTLDAETLGQEDFQVVTRSGAQHTPRCVTLRPASDAGELRTVLLIGELGDAANDPPASVRVIGDVHSDGATGMSVNFRDTHIQVTPLDAGPSLVLATVIPADTWSIEGRGTICPANTQQVVRVTWAGGVRLSDRSEPGDAERLLYRVTVKRPQSAMDGSSDEIAPAALADLGDGDNNHHLCLDTEDQAIAVAFPAGHLVDPNQDLNPDTHVVVSHR